MAANKIQQIFCMILMMIPLICVGGCVELATFVSTDEYIPSEEVVEHAGTLEHQTTEVYEDSFTIDFQAEAEVKYTITRELYWDNTQDLYGELLVKEDDLVEKGDIIATFEGSQSDEIMILERELAVEQAKASLNQVRQTYENLIAAQKESLTRLEGDEYEVARLRLEEMEYEYAYRLMEGEKRISEQQKALEEVLDRETKELVAPFDGKIVSVTTAFEKGEAVGNGAPIVKISDIESRGLVLKGSSIAEQVTYLSPVAILDPYTKDEYSGTIVSCPQVTQHKNSPVIIKLDDEVPEDREDIDYRVSGCILHKEKVTLVDARAVKEETTFSGKKLNYVYVLTENNAKYKVYVKVGANYNDICWIMDGLVSGQKVIIK